MSLRSLLPVFSWVSDYQRSWLRADILAGLAVWAMMVPQALAYAGIAGAPPVYGLYAVPLAMVVYAVLGTSRTLSVGPESAIAIISAVTVGALVVADPGRYLALTSLLALIVGVLFLLFGLLKLGWVAAFLSRPVLQGFTQGIALIVIVGQLPTLLGTNAAFAAKAAEMRNLPQLIGLDMDYSGVLVQAWALVATATSANLLTLIIGASSLILLFAFKRLVPSSPSALIAVLLGVIATTALGLTERGVAVIGEVETGMVALSVPAMSVADIIALLPGAFAIVLLGYAVSLSVAAVGAEATGEEIDPNQELVALGGANIGASLSAGFVVCGSLSRGVVIRRANGRTQVVSLVNASLVFLTLLFALPLFYRLPMAVLAAIVVQAMSGLLDFGYLKRLYRVSKGEFAYGMAALLGVLLLGILEGVAVGVILALVVLIRNVSRPGTAVLGRLPGTTDYRDVTAHPDAETIEGLLVFRFDAPIVFANAAYLAAQLRQLVAAAPRPIRQVLLPAQQINHIDSTGADQLAKLGAELRSKGIGLSFAEVKKPVREIMSQTGLDDALGADGTHDSIEDGVQAYVQRAGGAQDSDVRSS